MIFLLLSLMCNAQNPGDVAQVFGSSSPEIPAIQGIEPSVRAIVFQPDGKKIVGGSFTAYNGTLANRIIRLNPDNTIDTSFSTGNGFDNTVVTIVLRADGKILVGGVFNTYKGVTQKHIILLNSDGSKDVTFNTGNAFDGTVNSVLFQSDGKIMVAGTFFSFHGSTQNRIIRLHSNGSKDTTFFIGTGFNNEVRTMAMQTDGKIVVGGSFSSYNGMSANRIIRLNADGSKDSLFYSGLGFNSTVVSMMLQSNGKMVIGGHFTSYNGISANRIVRLNADGTKDTSFNTGTGFDNSVHSITTHLDGKILVGGNFTIYKDVAENGIICLNDDGTKNVAFNTGTGFVNGVFEIATHPDGKVGVGGWFTHYNSIPANKLITLNSDGTPYVPLQGLNSNVTALAVQPDEKIIVSGSFTSYKNTTENRIVRLNTDNTKDTSFNTGTGFNASVYETTLQNDGKIIVGGYFTSYKGITENRIVRLNTDGTKDTSFNTGTGFNNPVTTAVVQPDGKIIIGGDFTSYKGLAQNDIIRLNPDGTKDNSFNIGSGFNSPVESIVLQPDGKIIVAGGFTTYNGTTANRIIRLNPDGTKDTTFNIGTGFDKWAYNLALQPDGKIIVGGDFFTFNNTPDRFLIRLNPDGTKDTSFNTGTGVNNAIFAITLQSNGKIIIGGNFTAFNGSLQNSLVLLNPDGTKDNTFTIGSGFNEYVSAIVVHSDGKITAGGGFTSYKSSNSSAYLITLNGDVSLSNEGLLREKSIYLWPNPVQNVLNVGNLEGLVESLKVYNLQGKLMYENANAITAIDVSNYASGIYVVHLKTESNTFTKKFVKL